ncbi:hypothetical protein JCM10207_002650 [Rhodosporidiobolus poonsookiae]
MATSFAPCSSSSSAGPSPAFPSVFEQPHQPTAAYYASVGEERYSNEYATEDYPHRLAPPPSHFGSSDDYSSSLLPTPPGGNYHYSPAVASTSSYSPAPRSRPPPPSYTLAPPHQTGMSSTSSILEGDLDYDQYQQPSIGSSTSPDRTYYVEEVAPFVTSEPHEGEYADMPRFSSFSSEPDTYYQPGSGAVTPSLQCNLCGWAAPSHDAMDYHVRAHDGDCLFQCFIDGCEAAFSSPDDLISHGQRHRPVVPHGAGLKRSLEYEDAGEGYDQWATPSAAKRVCVQPITPITPSMGFAGTAAQQPRSSTISRTLSYEASPCQSAPLPRYSSFDDTTPTRRRSRPQTAPGDDFAVTPPLPREEDAPPADGLVETYSLPAGPSASPSTSAQPRKMHSRSHLLASPLPITSSAPVDRGRFQPYPEHLSSSSMTMSHSLPPPPEHFQTPVRARTIHSRRLEQYGESEPLHYQLPTPEYPSYPQQHLASPISPNELYPPALIPLPSPHGYSPSSRRSSTSSSHHTPAQAALVQAASINRLFARMSTPAHTGYPPYEAASPLAPNVSPQAGVTAVHPKYRIPPPVSPATIKAARIVNKAHVCVEEGCGKRFKRLEHLKRHERTHTLEKPYGCDVPGCNRFFSRSDNLAQHRKTHDRNGKTTKAMVQQAAARAAAENAAAQVVEAQSSSSAIYV